MLVSFDYSGDNNLTSVRVYLDGRMVAHAIKNPGKKSKKRVWQIAIRGVTWLESLEETVKPDNGYLVKTWSRKEDMEKDITLALTTGYGTIINIYVGHNINI